MEGRKAAEDLSDYFKTYFGDNLQKQLLKAPSPTEDVLAPSTRLIRRRREELDIHKAMEVLKEDFGHTLIAQHVREKDLQAREIQIKDYLSNFDSFLKENKVKQGRAMKKAERERELASQKAADLDVLREELKTLTKERDGLTAHAEKQEMYPCYLDKVVKHSEQFQDPWQVMSRVATLVQNLEDLLTSAQQNQVYAETARTQLTHYLEQTNDKLLHYNNRLAKLQSALDQARTETLHWESQWAYIQNTAAKKTLLLGTIKMATLNLYQTTIKRVKDGEPPVALEDTLKQLEKIQMFLRNLISIWDEVKKIETRPYFQP